MEQLELMLEGRKITLTPAAQRGEGEVWVPLEAFCDATGAVLKDIDGSGQLAVCDDGGDVCILLRDGDIHDVSGTPFGRLDAFAEPLQLSWSVTDDGVLAVLRQTSKSNTGLAVGDRPPKIELPDVVTGELISADVYYDKPAVFYMWASWWGCREQLPGWQSFYQQFADRVEVVSIAQDVQGPAVVLPWLTKAGTTFRTLVDQHNVLGKAFSLKYVPVAVIVDAQGRLVRPITGVNIGDDAFRTQLEAWATTGDIPEAWRDADAPESRDLTPAEREADARFQLALVLLETDRTEEALEQLRLAVQADPENWLIRKQMWAIEAPEAFYEGPVDYAWQKAQQEREKAGLLQD